VWPPAEVLNVLAALDRPEDPGLRWTTSDQWHVTLLFLGTVPDPDVPELAAALKTVASAVDGPLEAVLGPKTSVLGREVLCVRVAGLQPLAEPVRAVIGPLAGVTEEPPFTGHLTLARARGNRKLPVALRGVPLCVSWPVSEVCLVASTLGRPGAHYETLSTATLGGPR
jgi:RNA 2',3'-cyclic 3'-phosphodiesterase